MVTGVSTNSSNPTDNIANTTAKSQKALSQNYNDFLTLLTTQLKNQDPLDPQDASQFTSQIAQLSSVQEQINTNSNLEKLIAVIGGGQLTSAANYIGRVIEAKGDKSMKISDGTREGAKFIYVLPKEAATAKITVTDSAGRVVYNGNVPTTAGRNQVVWDGTNSLTGKKMPNGSYKFVISAQDSAGKAITPTTYTTGIVTSADLQDGQTILSLDDIQVPLSDITSIRTAQELL